MPAWRSRGARGGGEAPRACRREKMAVLRRVWVLVWSVPGCKGHTCRLPTVCTVSTELAGLVVRLSKFTISPTTSRAACVVSAHCALCKITCNCIVKNIFWRPPPLQCEPIQSASLRDARGGGMAVQPARRAYAPYPLERSRERRISFSNDPFPPGYVGAGGGEPERARRRPRARRARGAGGGPRSRSRRGWW